MNTVPDPQGHDETATEYFQRLSRPATPHTDKMVELARVWREIDQEELELERKRIHQQDELWEARYRDKCEAEGINPDAEDE